MIFAPIGLFGSPRPWLHGEEAVVERVRMVLETRPGRLPWRPEFGCDLEGFVGQSATSGRLREIQWRVEQALGRWVPEVQVQRCEVRVSAPNAPGGSHMNTPLAESALLSLGPQAVLEIFLDLRTKAGPLSLQASLSP